MRLNWAVLGLIIGIGIGGFALSFGVDFLVRQVQANLGWLAALLLIALTVLLFAGWIFQHLAKRYLQPKYQNLSEVLADTARSIARVARLNNEEASRISETIRSAAAIYGNWSFRILLIRAIVGLLFALGGVFATYVLIQQNELLGRQLELLKDQNEAVDLQTSAVSTQTQLLRDQVSLSSFQSELQALNLVDSLRVRLNSPIIEDYDLPVSLSLSADELIGPVSEDSCFLGQRAVSNKLYRPANRSQLLSVASLADSEDIGDRVVSALVFLLSDDNPSVAFSAFLILDRLGALPDAHDEFTFENILLNDLSVSSEVRIRFESSRLNRFSCANCSLSLASSFVSQSSVRRIELVDLTTLLGVRPYDQDQDGRTSETEWSNLMDGAIVSLSVLDLSDNLLDQIMRVEQNPDNSQITLSQEPADRFELSRFRDLAFGTMNSTVGFRAPQFILNSPLDTVLAVTAFNDQTPDPECGPITHFSNSNPFFQYTNGPE